jgi:hypothetical protein
MPSAINNGEGGSPLMSNITDRRAVADTLRKARAIIAPDGAWIQGSFSDRCGGHCAAGAILEAVADCDEEFRWEAFRALFRAVPRVNSSPALWAWNDSKKRTQAEVLAAFDKAITLADSSQ